MEMFEWDERKNAQTQADKGLDFADATALFHGRPRAVFGADRDGDARWLTIGLLDNGKCDAVVRTQREHATRIISFRRSHDDERRAYHARHG
jgi:hypothetical protein